MRSQSGYRALVDVSPEDVELAKVEVENALQRLVGGKAVEMVFKVFRKARSIDANALMWHCLTEIAKALRMDKWDVYKLMLVRYTEGIPIAVEPEKADDIAKTYREVERLNDIEIGGKTYAYMMLYAGSSTFDAATMSNFLDCIIDEMREMGLETPTPERTREVIEAYAREHEEHC